MHFFKYLQSRKPIREAVGPLDDHGIKGLLKEDGETAEKLNHFFASGFSMGRARQKLIPEPLFSRRKSEELI